MLAAKAIPYMQICAQLLNYSGDVLQNMTFVPLCPLCSDEMVDGEQFGISKVLWRQIAAVGPRLRVSQQKWQRQGVTEHRNRD